MQLVQGLLHSASMAIFLCGLPNTSELHYASLDSYQTPPVLLPLMKALWLGDTACSVVWWLMVGAGLF
jgi:hypothetical protein